MKIIEKSEHPEQYSITDLERGEVYRLTTRDTLYIKVGASTTPTPYNYVNLANGVLGTVSEDFKGLLKVEGAFVENYKSDDDPDSINEQLIAKQAQCNQLWDTLQNLKNDYRNLERQLEEQEKQLAEARMSIGRLKADRVQLQNACKDSDNLLQQIIDAAYSGEMKGLESIIIENPKRLLDKISNLANTARQHSKENTTD